MILKPEDFPTYRENRIHVLQGIAQRGTTDIWRRTILYSAEQFCTLESEGLLLPFTSNH